MAGNQHPVPRGRVRRTMPLAGFTARVAGGRVVAALREKTGNACAVERFHERTAQRYTELLGIEAITAAVTEHPPPGMLGALSDPNEMAAGTAAFATLMTEFLPLAADRPSSLLPTSSVRIAASRRRCRSDTVRITASAPRWHDWKP